MTLSPQYNNTLVPWTTLWSGENDEFRVQREHYTDNRWAICQKSAPGTGGPIFGSVHYQRQRQAIIMGRCDVCGRNIRPGQARVLLSPGNHLKGTNTVGHVMAPSHRECARAAALVCPWILKEIQDERLTVMVAVKTQIALAILDPEVVVAETGHRYDFPVVGHAKLIVDKSLERDAKWLLRKVEICTGG